MINGKQVLVLSAAVALVSSAWIAHLPKTPEFKCPPTDTVVYTTMDIPPGATIPTEALEERSVLVTKIPQDAITRASLAAGRMTKYGIAKGQIVSQHDLAAQS